MTKLVQRLVFAQIMDAATFAAFFILVPISVHVERNPVIGTLYAMGGFALVACVKVLVTLIVGYRTISSTAEASSSGDDPDECGDRIRHYRSSFQHRIADQEPVIAASISLRSRNGVLDEPISSSSLGGSRRTEALLQDRQVRRTDRGHGVTDHRSPIEV